MRSDPTARRSLGPAWLWGALLLLAALGGGVLYFLPPDQYGFYPQCLLFATTGWQCPGCGGLRAVHHLLHGDWQRALALNPLVVLAGPLLLLGAAVVGWGKRRVPPSPRWSDPVRWVWLGITLIVLFAIGRNLWPAWTG